MSFQNKSRVFLLAILCTSCGFRYIDVASAPESAYWKKQGYTADMIAMVMAGECKDTNANFSGLEKSEFYERWAEVQRCMLDRGFTYTLDGKPIGFRPLEKDTCSRPELKNLPACRSLAEAYQIGAHVRDCYETGEFQRSRRCGSFVLSNFNESQAVSQLPDNEPTRRDTMAEDQQLKLRQSIGTTPLPPPPASIQRH